jgi:sporadic carbohydrate cluster protein (TIGR04323 family)
MTVATITTDINIGPFKIPSNGQNMIMNNYANRVGITVEIVIPEPMKSNVLATTQWLMEDMKIETIILCSIHQLPKKDEDFIKLRVNLKNIMFHFALEGLSGKGIEFLDHCKKEAKSFDDAEHLSSDYSWSDLYKQINK